MNSVIKISSDVCYVSGSWRWNAGRSEYARYFNSVLIHHHNRALVLFTYVTSVNGGHQAVFNSQIVRFITTIWHTVLSLAFKCLLDILHNGLCSWVGSRCIWCPHSITVIIYKFVHLSDTGHHTRHQPWPDPESAATRLTTTSVLSAYQSLSARWYLFESCNCFTSVQTWLFKLCIMWHFYIQPPTIPRAKTDFGRRAFSSACSPNLEPYTYRH